MDMFSTGIWAPDFVAKMRAHYSDPKVQKALAIQNKVNMKNTKDREALYAKIQKKKIDLDQIDDAMKKWFKKMIKSGKVKRLPDYDPDKDELFRFVKSEGEENMHILVIKPHRSAERCSLDYGRGVIVNFDPEKPETAGCFRFYQDNGKYAATGYFTKDARHNHLRLGSTDRQALVPPQGLGALLRTHINYSINAPQNKQKKETKKENEEKTSE